jgi:hypothetical protein
MVPRGTPVTIPGVQRDIRVRRLGGSSSVTGLPVAERMVHSIEAARMASPAPVVIGGRSPAPLVDDRTGWPE